MCRVKSANWFLSRRFIHTFCLPLFCMHWKNKKKLFRRGSNESFQINTYMIIYNFIWKIDWFSDPRVQKMLSKFEKFFCMNWMMINFTSFIYFSFGKRTGGSARRPNECFVLEPSEMIAVIRNLIKFATLRHYGKVTLLHVILRCFAKIS